jgi:APA family basic amino acid/polyamine antiporter
MANTLWAKKFTTKLQHDASAEDNQLTKSLTSTSLVAFGIGAIIGAGLLPLTGSAAAVHVGSAVILPFVLAAFGCALTELCYADLRL